MYFLVAYVSDFRVLILVVFLSNACLYELNFSDTEVLFLEFNKIFLLLFYPTIVTVPHHHAVHM